MNSGKMSLINSSLGLYVFFGTIKSLTSLMLQLMRLLFIIFYYLFPVSFFFFLFYFPSILFKWRTFFSVLFFLFWIFLVWKISLMKSVSRIPNFQGQTQHQEDPSISCLFFYLFFLLKSKKGRKISKT